MEEEADERMYRDKDGAEKLKEKRERENEGERKRERERERTRGNKTERQRGTVTWAVRIDLAALRACRRLGS